MFRNCFMVPLGNPGLTKNEKLKPLYDFENFFDSPHHFIHHRKLSKYVILFDLNHPNKGVGEGNPPPCEGSITKLALKMHWHSGNFEIFFT